MKRMLMIAVAIFFSMTFTPVAGAECTKSDCSGDGCAASNAAYQRCVKREATIKAKRNNPGVGETRSTSSSKNNSGRSGGPTKTISQ